MEEMADSEKKWRRNRGGILQDAMSRSMKVSAEMKEVSEAE